MVSARRRFLAVFEHELRTLRRTRSVWVLGVGFVLLVLGVALLGGTSGWVPLSVALLAPLELLVPALAAALGYRSILADRERDELSMLRTYPLGPGTYALGVYAGRLVAVLGIVVGALLLAGLVVPLTGPSPASLTRTGGLDSPVYYLRFVSLTALFAAAALALMVLLSALARNARRGVVAAIGATVVVALGADLGFVLAFGADLVSASSLPWYLTLSPASGYRGLVLAHVVAPVTVATEPVSPYLGFVSLALWTAFAVVFAGWRAWGPTRYVIG